MKYELISYFPIGNETPGADGEGVILKGPAPDLPGVSASLFQTHFLFCSL